MRRPPPPLLSQNRAKEGRPAPSPSRSSTHWGSGLSQPHARPALRGPRHPRLPDPDARRRGLAEVPVLQVLPHQPPGSRVVACLPQVTQEAAARTCSLGDGCGPQPDPHLPSCATRRHDSASRSLGPRTRAGRSDLHTQPWAAPGRRGTLLGGWLPHAVGTCLGRQAGGTYGQKRGSEWPHSAPPWEFR